MDSRYQRPKYQAHRRSPATARGVGEACARAPGSSPDNTVGLPRRFQATVGIINGVDVAKFPAVLTRLIRKLHTKVSEPGGSARLASTRPLVLTKPRRSAHRVRPSARMKRRSWLACLG